MPFYVKIIALVAFCFLISCNSTDKQQLQQDSWTISSGKDDIFFYNFKCVGDTLIFNNDMGFIEKMTFEIKKDHLLLHSIDRKEDTLLPFTYYNKDSIKLGNNRYRSYNGEPSGFNIKLVDIPTPSKVDGIPIHTIPLGLLKYEEKSVLVSDTTSLLELREYESQSTIVIGGKIIPKELLTIYTTSSHRTVREDLMVLVGEDIDLSLLKFLQLELLSMIQKKTFLVTKREGLDTYHTLPIRPFYFQEDLDVYIKQINSPPPPPFPEEFNSKSYFLKHGGIILDIDSLEKTNLLDSLEKDKNYVIKISENLSIDTYIHLLLKLEQLKSEGIKAKYYIY